MEKRSIARSAQYGQACMSCFKAKCRCVVRREGDGCERCHRLNRECRPSDALHRRTRTAATENTQDTESDGRIARLEGRLEGLVSLLQSRQLLDGDTSHTTAQPQPQFPQRTTTTTLAEQPRPPSTATPSSSSSGVPTDPTAGSEDVVVDEIGPLLVNTSDPSTLTQPAVTESPFHPDRPLEVPTLSTDPDPDPDPLPASSDPEDPVAVTCLDTFRSRMLHHFPIAHLPATLTAQQLSRDRPLFFQAIVCVTFPLSREKRARAVELKRKLCETAFLQQYQDTSGDGADPTVDLLLGLLTYIAWGWDHLHSRRSLSRLMMLCMSLVGEMHLDRPAPVGLHTSNLLTPVSQKDEGETQVSMERQRAVLGCFVLSSVVSAYFADMDALRWTSQMEDIRITVNANKESSTDAHLATQSLLQLLATKAVELGQSLHVRQRQGSDVGQPGVSAATVSAEAEALLSQVQELRKSLSWASSSQQSQQAVLAHTCYVELLILEIIRISSFIVSLSNAFIGAGTGAEPNGAQAGGAMEQPQAPPGSSDLSYMWQSVLSISACTSGLLGLAPSDFAGISFLQWEQIAGCVVVLGHLEDVRDPRINLAAARAVVDLPVLLDRIAEKLETAAGETGEKGTDGAFTQMASGIRTFRSNIQGSTVELARPGPGEVSGCGGSNTVAPQAGPMSNSRFWMDQLFTG